MAIRTIFAAVRLGTDANENLPDAFGNFGGRIAVRVGCFAHVVRADVEDDERG